MQSKPAKRKKNKKNHRGHSAFLRSCRTRWRSCYPIDNVSTLIHYNITAQSLVTSSHIATNQSKTSPSIK
jgi:hypothetical protein